MSESIPLESRFEIDQGEAEIADLIRYYTRVVQHVGPDKAFIYLGKHLLDETQENLAVLLTIAVAQLAGVAS